MGKKSKRKKKVIEERKKIHEENLSVKNLFDPAIIDEYMYSSQGQTTILNVIGNR